MSTSEAPRSATAAADPARWCRDVCLDLPGAVLDHPFHPDVDAFRIHGRIFALRMHNPKVSEHPFVNLKADPDEIPLLVEAYDSVRPGYHMNKRHWVTVVLAPGVDLGLVTEFIEDSYDSVVAGLPARLRSTLRSLGPGPSARVIAHGDRH